MACPTWCTHDHARFSADVHSQHVYRDHVASVSISQFESPYLSPAAHISIIRQNFEAPSAAGYLSVRPGPEAAAMAGLLDDLGQPDLAAAVREASDLLDGRAEGPVS